MKKITGEIWKEAILSGSNNIQNKKTAINALNVFPVPDGDTGSNMASTIAAAVEIQNIKNGQNLAEASRVIAQNMLLSARGNSGVILSQIFKGFANGFKGKEEASPFDLVNAFEQAAKVAYGAVLKPIEGTILTVIREVAEGLKDNVVVDSNIEDVLDIALQLARKSCDNTPNLLKVLKEVGVTDSGGEGLYAILEGMKAYFDGEAIEISDKEDTINKFISDTEVFSGEFGYCTEFILELYKPKKFDKDYLIKKLEKIGSSMVVVQDESILKIHIHTQKPGAVLSSVNSIGQFLKVKIDNMTLQANNSKETAKKNSNDEACENKHSAGCALISCNAGQGIIDMVQDYGVSYVVEGGQTNNPSIQDIVNAINSVAAKTVFILPNNSNITLSAQQAATIVRNKKVIIIPTKSQAQCLGVAMNFSPENSAKENQTLMNDALKTIQYGEIAPSVKDTKLNGIKVKKGDFMVISANKLVSTAKTYNEAAIKLVDDLVSDDTEIVTIFYGQDASEADAKELQNYIEINYNVEVEVYSGGQTIYPYLISAQ
ncbi:DAK2 domain-containing protein [Metamycoplasma neophronis]|uniref:DAK2 domain-containing protein n=1 Tax=Metamycoplasma neophronis TaxID=872983 RepID=A0ABY2Z0R0_9BACT|nr:DAK2 domain-containing protein [Metamycoplasma neophronis]TPR54741.1 DAK2 domain-containing protein [Metamycoplasma neophronis]